MSTNIKKYTFKDGLPLELEVISISTIFAKNKEMIIVPHRTDFYHVIWFQKGSPIHLVDFNPIKIKPNTLLFINKNQVHLFDKSGEYTGKIIIFTDNFFCKNEQDISFLQRTVLFNNLLTASTLTIDTNSQLFIPLLKAIEDEFACPPDVHQDTILKNMLHTLLLQADRIKRTKGVGEVNGNADLKYALRFKQCLEKQFIQSKSVTAFAQQMNISEKRLKQATAKIIGKNPKEIINERVLLEAKRVLVHEDKTIKEISFELGFKEATNFIKYFRKHTGKTPVEFKDNYFSGKLPKSIV